MTTLFRFRRAHVPLATPLPVGSTGAERPLGRRVRAPWLCVAPVGRGPVREELPLQQLCVLGYAGQGEETFRRNEPVRLSLGVDVLRTCRPLCDSLGSHRGVPHRSAAAG